MIISGVDTVHDQKSVKSTFPHISIDESVLSNLSVPIHRTEEIIREIGPAVRKGGLLMDLTSLKKAPVEAMLKYSGAEVLGVHPLFGPCEKSHHGASEEDLFRCPRIWHRGSC